MLGQQLLPRVLGFVLVGYIACAAQGQETDAQGAIPDVAVPEFNWEPPEGTFRRSSDPVTLDEYPARPGQPWPRFVVRMALPDMLDFRVAGGSPDARRSQVRVGRVGPQDVPAFVPLSCFLAFLDGNSERCRSDARNFIESVANAKDGYTWLDSNTRLTPEQRHFMEVATWLATDHDLRDLALPDASGRTVILFAVTEADARTVADLLLEAVGRVQEAVLRAHYDRYRAQIKETAEQVVDVAPLEAQQLELEAQRKQIGLDYGLQGTDDAQAVAADTKKQSWLVRARITGMNARIAAVRKYNDDPVYFEHRTTLERLLVEYDIELIGVLAERDALEERIAATERYLELDRKGDQLRATLISQERAAGELQIMLSDPPRLPPLSLGRVVISPAALSNAPTADD